MQNYIMLHYLEGAEYKTQMIRCTITHSLLVFSEPEHSFIVRCHRSYLVNLNAVNEINGNAQGLKLSINKMPSGGCSVPVSRSYVGDFKVAFAQIS
jgi:DNA-binding LytR/AlgR family response regulator